MASDLTIKSTAVVKRCTMEEAPQFLQLSSNTDLNNPPSNWLRMRAIPHQEEKAKQGAKNKAGPWAYPKNNASAFSSFGIAHNFPDCIGEVDVVSDAENIKKLLKMPFSKSHISMMVHRVGKTLLLDEFDIHSHLLRASKKQWEWLRKFYYEHILQTLQENEKCLRKNKSRDYLQSKNMVSKFLYYSLMEEDEKTETELKEEVFEEFDGFSGAQGGCERQLSSPQRTCHKNPSISPVRHHSSGSLLCSPSVEQLLPDISRGEIIDGDEQHEFLRNVLWTFEDIRMLIGSDLPIFGGGTHPVVSLRLRDMQKPINILTGLDYWLDNLMCNVPEVVMCYHLDGIVQKYELLKTEEIPQMSSSQFSPKVVKDIAQNVLSFLKSKATKSGHTYWLFKGKNDDVVKLYDLTTVLEEKENQDDDFENDTSPRNPFTLPVAMLLYRVARNMKESDQAKPGTIFKLINNCLALIDKKTHPQVAASAHYLLADMFLPNDFDPLDEQELCPSEASDDTWPSCSESEPEDDTVKNVSFSVEVDSLSRPSLGSIVKGLSDAEKALTPWKPGSWEERCTQGIKQVAQGLQCLINCDKETEKKSEAEAGSGEWTNFAHPSESIPLPFFPLKSKVETSELMVTKMRLNSKDENSVRCWVLLLNKAAHLYAALGQISCQRREYGTAMKCLHIGLLCKANASNKSLLEFGNSAMMRTNPLIHLLGLAGDIHIMLSRYDPSELENFKEEFSNPLPMDCQIVECLNLKDVVGFAWSFAWPGDNEAALNLSAKCYKEALNLCLEKNASLQLSLSRRLANATNELGIFYMNQGILVWKDTGTLNEHVMVRWKNSEEYLKTALSYFDEVGDHINTALLNSNLGRLMRLWATAYAGLPSRELVAEFSPKEKKFFGKAVRLYKAALTEIRKSELRAQPQHTDAIQWDLCTTLYTMATLLQDRAPLSTCSQEEVEKEVEKLMTECLDLCRTESDSAKASVYQYRAASIHHRLASLYHNAFRNSMLEDQRRKHQRLAAEDHYAKALMLFSTVGTLSVFLKVLLEWMGLSEAALINLTRSRSRSRTLQSILEKTLLVKPMLEDSSQQPVTSTQSTEDEEDLREVSRLLLLFQGRLKQLVESLVKAQGKGSKQTWFKTLQLLNQEHATRANLMKLLCDALEDIKKCLEQS